MHSPKVLADRFRVFAYVKRIKKEEDRIPSYDEVAQVLDIGRTVAGEHIRALRNADGFPKFRDNRGRHDSHMRSGHCAALSRGENFDENALLLTDIFAVTDG